MEALRSDTVTRQLTNTIYELGTFRTNVQVSISLSVMKWHISPPPIFIERQNFRSYLIATTKFIYRPSSIEMHKYSPSVDTSILARSKHVLDTTVVATNEFNVLDYVQFHSNALFSRRWPSNIKQGINEHKNMKSFQLWHCVYFPSHDFIICTSISLQVHTLHMKTVHTIANVLIFLWNIVREYFPYPFSSYNSSLTASGKNQWVLTYEHI
jgi:hypothetical protein